MAANAGEDVGTGEQLVIPGGSADLYSHCRNECDGSTSGNWETDLPQES